MKDLEQELRGAGGADVGAAVARATAGLRARAEEAGLVDIAYASIDSPLGTLLAMATRRGLVRLAYPANDFDTVLEDMAARVSPRIMEAPARLDGARRELDEYFHGRRTRFDLPLDWSLIHGFGVAVLKQTSRIPYGSVATYREVAIRAGSPLAARAAGNALGANPIPIVIPCHRVLHSGGGLGGYTGGLDKKELLLRLEGVLPAATAGAPS
ncbi:MAG: methylated-DNA-[protein]-cysteine S-methyltransferase [Chloroflexota bacterium]|jgi:methylated-DNA-[protein]-cysteine S-methyltransferase|nr:methylated-DNA-[protein]-cysteine S-methyltransferase [Chloroflexota bacterium]